MHIHLLELQLKDHHQPLRMRMKWPDLLRRFTAASTEMIEKGENFFTENYFQNPYYGNSMDLVGNSKEIQF